MKSLEQHNFERWADHAEIQKMNEPHPNGIACPQCGKELWDSNPMAMLTSNPPQMNIHCPTCKYVGYRLA